MIKKPLSKYTLNRIRNRAKLVVELLSHGREPENSLVADMVEDIVRLLEHIEMMEAERHDDT